MSLFTAHPCPPHPSLLLMHLISQKPILLSVPLMVIDKTPTIITITLKVVKDCTWVKGCGSPNQCQHFSYYNIYSQIGQFWNTNNDGRVRDKICNNIYHQAMNCFHCYNHTINLLACLTYKALIFLCKTSSLTQAQLFMLHPTYQAFLMLRNTRALISFMLVTNKVCRYKVLVVPLSQIILTVIFP